MMGCASSHGGNIPMSSGSDKSAGDSGPTGASAKYPPAEAFEISLDDDVDNDNDDRSDSLIKKHPPKRLQKLVEQAATAVPPTTVEDLEEKLAKAEVRRQQYIQQRIDNIISVTGKGAVVNAGETTDAGDADEGNDGQNDSVDGKTVILTSSQHADGKELTQNDTDSTQKGT